MVTQGVRRRDVLRGAGAVGGLAMAGRVAAGPPDRYNVGTASRAAERRTRRRAESVHRELDWRNGTKTISARLSDEAAACDNCTTFVHDSLPDSEWCGLGIYDDRVGFCCHDSETGVLQAGVDTGSPAALAWAESLYERYRAEARPLDGEDLLAV